MNFHKSIDTKYHEQVVEQREGIIIYISAAVQLAHLLGIPFLIGVIISLHTIIAIITHINCTEVTCHL